MILTIIKCKGALGKGRHKSHPIRHHSYRRRISQQTVVLSQPFVVIIAHGSRFLDGSEPRTCCQAEALLKLSLAISTKLGTCMYGSFHILNPVCYDPVYGHPPVKLFAREKKKEHEDTSKHGHGGYVGVILWIRSLPAAPVIWNLQSAAHERQATKNTRDFTRRSDNPADERSQQNMITDTGND